MRRVLALTGFDRSGTTFLGRHIQQKLSNTFFIGELDKGIAGLTSGRYMKCSCGNELAQCSIWSHMKKEVGDAKDSPENIISVVCGKIFQLVGPTVIIDSSKDLQHVTRLITVFKDLNILLHVVRNPKGIVFSRMKTRIERVKRGRHPKPRIASKVNMMMIYDSIAWSMTNIYIELFLKYKAHQYHRLIYERSETELPVFLKTYFNELLTEPGNYFHDSHVIFGNMNRFQEGGTIRIDEAWKEHLKGYQKIIVDLITFPVRLLFNYKF